MKTNNVELMKAMVSTHLHNQADNTNLSIDDLVKEATKLRRALRKLYTLNDLEWINVLQDINSYADSICSNPPTTPPEE